MSTKIKKFIQDSLFYKNFDNLAYILLLGVLFCAIILPSDYQGLIALLFSSMMIFRIFLKDNSNFKLEKFDKALIVYFLIVTMSLFGSTLFKLSFHGYIKTLIYILFYFSATLFFKDNKNKIAPTLFFVCFLMSYESIIAILQNFRGVDEISGWQDMSNLNPEQVVSRAYGTLLPYNPNLLAGYLLCGLSSFIYFIFLGIKNKKIKTTLIFLALFLINLVAIVVSGCRGAYLGFLLFFPCLFIGLINYVKKYFGGLSNIKKRYKNLFIGAIVALAMFIVTNPALIKRVQSIFAFRQDSSISFRLNVYESAIRMFLDNIFFGIGVGNQNFREIYGLYMKTGYDALGSYCVPLEIAVESGIFALLAFVLFLYFVFKKCFLVLKTDNIQEKIFCFSLILMLLAVIGHGLFDTIWFRPQLQFLFWTNIAMLKAIK